MKTVEALVTQNLRKMFATEYLDFAKVIGGAFSRNLLRGFFKILIAGFLAPQALGILYSVNSFFRIMTRLAEFGLNYGMIRFVARAIQTGEHDEKDQILKIVLFMNVLIVLGFLAIWNVFAEKIASWVLSDPSLTIYVRLAALAVGGRLLWQYISSYLSAHQDFGRLAFFLATLPFLMLIVALILIILNRFNLPAGILIYLFAPLVTALMWWPALNWRFVRQSAWDMELMGSIIRFSRWVYFSNVVSSARNHANTLFLKNTWLSGSLAAGEVNAGLYSFGNDMAGQVGLLSESLYRVLLPKAASKTDARKLRRFVKRSYTNLIILIIPIALLMFLAKPMIHLLAYFKNSYLEYLPSLQVFVILYAGSLFSVAAIPMKVFLYALKRPQVETYVETVVSFVMVGGSILLIPRYGYIGAASMVLVARALSLGAILSYGLIKLKNVDLEIT